MKSTHEESDRGFAELVRRARDDRPAPIDTTALLRAVRQTPATRAGWWGDFAALFASRTAFASCSAGALASLALAGWLAWDTWQNVLPWAELLTDGPLFS